ncbi:hypothetical protein ABIC14_001908 [Pseudomonas sp. PvP046]|uniref:hypothetical protein n=1 Tax=Pseudomonas sp. PvP046 TaxID=3156389 RepID=UPI00339B2C5B
MANHSTAAGTWAKRLKFDRREPTLIILMGTGQFLHIFLIIGSPAIVGHVFGHESNVKYGQAAFETDKRQ